METSCAVSSVNESLPGWEPEPYRDTVDFQRNVRMARTLGERSAAPLAGSSFPGVTI